MRLAKAGIGGYNTRTVATHPSFSEIDYAQRPFILFWELTTAVSEYPGFRSPEFFARMRTVRTRWNTTAAT